MHSGRERAESSDRRGFEGDIRRRSINSFAGNENLKHSAALWV